jgi:ketosteroid isomerase-like protein
VLAVVACVACSPTPAQRGREASAAEVEVAFKRFEEAWEREDLESAVNAFTPDAVVFDPVPPGRFEKTEGIRAWISGSFNTLEQIAIDTTDLRLLTMGPVAWGTGHYVFAAQQGGNPVRVEGDLTMVWVLQTDGSYKLSVFHASHAPGASSG